MKEEFLNENIDEFQYPDRLLPHSDNKYINEYELTSIPTLLARFTKEQFNHTHSDSHLSQLIVPISNHLLNLSVNLMGIFEKDDIFIQIEKEQENYDLFLTEWDGQTSMKHLKPVFQVDKNRGCFYFTIEALKEPFEFQRIDLNNNQKVQYKIVPLISHKPINTNFWHCEISWVVNNNRLEETAPKSLKRDILNFLKLELIRIKSEYCDCSGVIDSSFYTK